MEPRGVELRVCGEHGWVGRRKVVVGKWRQLCLNINKNGKKKEVEIHSSFISLSVEHV